MRIFWSTRAERELDAALAFIAERSPRGARRISERIEKRVADLSQFPEQGVSGRNGLRRLEVARTPYLIIYRIEQDKITVVAILHGRRKRRD